MHEPRDEAELMARAEALAGRTLDELSRAARFTLGDEAVRTKGKVGELIERLLGATGGPAARHDFPSLGIELKTIPVDARGKPRESTYVCRVPLADAETAEWETSWARAKLSRVLWVAVVMPERRVAGVRLWSPGPEEEATLRADFEEAMGAIALGGIEGVSAHAGEALQVRPKARDGSVRTTVVGPERELVSTVPRGFYLRPSFTERIVRGLLSLQDV
jgi:DNA mismatch repair protein MutH